MSYSVMSGIITAPAFNNMFEATRDNATMRGTVSSYLRDWMPDRRHVYSRMR